MKKRLVVIVALLIAAVMLVVLFLCLQMPGCPAQKRTIEEINRNCGVPFALAMPETELKNTDEYVRREGFGCYDLENEDVTFRLAGYPDALDKFHIIKYEIKSSKYAFMGLRVGCSLDEAREVMKQNGYTLSDHIYRKNGVVITIFSIDGVAVTTISVFVETTNVHHVIF